MLRLMEKRSRAWRDLCAHWREAASGQAEIISKIIAQWNECAEAGLQSVTQSEVAAMWNRCLTSAPANSTFAA